MTEDVNAKDENEKHEIETSPTSFWTINKIALAILLFGLIWFLFLISLEPIDFKRGQNYLGAVALLAGCWIALLLYLLLIPWIKLLRSFAIRILLFIYSLKIYISIVSTFNAVWEMYWPLNFLMILSYFGILVSGLKYAKIYLAIFVTLPLFIITGKIFGLV